MTLEDCVQVLIPMALALRAEVDDPTFRAYHRVLKDVPLPLFEMACEGLLHTGIEFLPSAPKLLAACEKARRQWLQAHPHDACAECEGQRGFRNIIAPNGTRTVERCPCVGRYQEQLQSRGLATPLALLPTDSADEWTETREPTVGQLPEGVQARVREISAQKGMR